jgi:hypothetical protein
MFYRWRQSGLLVVALLLSALVAAGCGKKKSDEKLAEGMMERTLKSATGEKADVDLNGENVTITTSDGRVEMAKTSEWPSDMFSDVPRFTYGVVERVSKEQAGGMQKFNVYLRDVEDGAFEKYHADIKAAGWESQSMMQGDSGGMISAQKGNLALQFVCGKDDHTGVVLAYSMPE